MMYHFMFGLRGASAVAVAPSAAGCALPSPPLGVSFFSSSIGLLLIRCFRPLVSVSLEIIEQRRHAVKDDVVHDPEIERENKDRDHDHGGGGANFLPTGRRDLAGLGAHVVVESLDAFRPGLDLVAEV